MRDASSRSRAKTMGLGMSRPVKGAIHVPHASPETYRLGVLPRPLPIVAVLRRPMERFVMVNLLVFKKAASKPHEGRSGREAYMTYAATVERIQGSLGSRLLWSGDLEAQLIGGSEPRFEMAGLLEYTSPRAFLGFAFAGRSDGKARSAGLAGQWLLACTTVERAEAPDADANGLALLELVGDAEPAWRTSWRSEITRGGGRLLWSGRVDQRVIGAASPAVRRVVLHALPIGTQVAGFFASDPVQALRAEKARPRPWWVFAARSVDLLPGLR